MSVSDELMWIVALRTAAADGQQRAAAKRIGYSAAVVSQVLSGSYKGDWKAVQQAVEGALLGATVDCPVAGDIPRNRCLEHQRSEATAASPMSVELAQTCPTCVNRKEAQ
jgi:DNA-binding transcriptional regulator YdaS (Cro superfamily)